jgi:Kef-type K+ transport system membrane component KefB
VAFVTLASLLGLETILGAFVAGVILRFVDADRMLTHPQFRQKVSKVNYFRTGALPHGRILL